jgi:hypothetical protein
MFRLRLPGDAKDRRGRRCAASKLPCHLSEELFLRGGIFQPKTPPMSESKTQTFAPRNARERREMQIKQGCKRGCLGCSGLIVVYLCGAFIWAYFTTSSDQKAREERRQELSGSYEGKVQFIIEGSFSTLELCEVSAQVDGGYAVHVKWGLGDNWSNESARKKVFMQLHTFLSGASKKEDLSQVVRYWFDPQIKGVDKFGAKSVVSAAKIIIPRETINKIQWDDFDWRMLMDLCESEGMVTWRPVILSDG